MLDLTTVDKTWTLFLDRDGVLNHEKPMSYVFNRDEFIFYDGVTEAMEILNHHFGTIVVVTNQKGIGKQLMTLNDLYDIHTYMMQEILHAGGRINSIYFCSDMEDNSPNRKPNPGMAFQAQKDFPEIDFKKSIMVGNKLSDMKFGRAAGMHTVFIASTNPETPFPHELIDARFNSLHAFAKAFPLTKA